MLRCLPVVAAATLAFLAASPAAAFTFTKIVDTNTPVPNGGGANFSIGLGYRPAVSGGNVAFLANTGEVWTSTITGTVKRKAIIPAFTIPGGGGAHFQLSFADFVQIHGNTVVLVGEDCYSCDTGLGIYTVPVGGGPRTRLVDVNTLRPGSATDHFGRFSRDFHANNSRVVFSNGQQVYSVPLAGGSPTYVTDPSCQAFDHACLSSLPTVDSSDRRVLMKGCSIFDNCDVHEFTVGGAGPYVDASSADHPPGTLGGYRFDSFHASFDLLVLDQTSDHRFVVFKGEGTATNKPRVAGVYSRGPAGFFRLVDSTIPVPGGTGTFTIAGFTDPSGYSLGAANGIVIFRGVDAAGKLGIYAVRATGGTITKIIAQGDPISGHTVDTGEPASLGFRRDGFDGTTFVFLAQYADGGRGLFSTPVTLP